MGISVGDAVLKITGDSADLDKELKNIDSKVKSTTGNMSRNFQIAGAAMTGAGMAIVGSMIAITKKWSDAGDEVQKLALKTGFTTEKLSELRYMAELGGTSLGTLEVGIKTMQKSIYYAGQGLETYTRLFDELGISIEELQGKTPEQQFERITMAIADLEDPTIKAAVAAQLFGRSGTDLLPILADGADGMKKLAQEAHDMGVVFDQEAADAAARFNDSMTRLKSSFQGVGTQIAENLAPILSDFLEKASKIISKITAWAKAHPGLTRMIVLGAAALGGLMLVLGPLLMMMPGIIALLPIMAGGFGLLGGAIAFATGPILPMIAAIVALIAIGILLVKNWDKIREFFVNSIEAIKNAMVAPFRAAAQGIENAINWIISMINKISFDVPDWVPLLGGKHFGFNIPEFRMPSFKGFEGIIPGIPGTPIPAVVHAGEYIGQGKGDIYQTVNINNPVVRSDDDITKITKQVAREMYRMQMVRYG